jgi:arsenite methyltransferase
LDNNKLNIEDCAVIDFMAHFVGLSILHPGGYNTTDRLTKLCDTNSSTKVLDIGCGKGTSSIYLAQSIGCKVVGIDNSERRIEEAKAIAKKKKVDHLVEFILGDVHKLPFDDKSFDVAITQASLFYFDKNKVLKECLRILKDNGRFGAVELSWKKKPSKELLADAEKVLHEDYVFNTPTYTEWLAFFNGTGLKDLHTEDIAMWGMQNIMREAPPTRLKIFFRILTNPRIRKRMKAVTGHFKKFDDYYQIKMYVGKK